MTALGVKMLSLALIRCVSAGNYSTYSEDLGKYLIDFAGASYCGGTLGHGVNHWNCFACKRHPNVNATVVSKQTLFFDFNSFVAHDGNTNRVVLAIAGTDPLKIQDWIDDLDFTKTSYSPCRPPASTGCKVHKGFYKTYANVQEKLRATVTEYLSTYPGAEFHITGHSLGGILSVFAAVDLMDAVLPSFPNVSISSVYTFGEPRGGDQDYAQFVQSALAAASIPHFRVTHDADPVPHLPPEAMGYRHPPWEIYYQQSNSLGKFRVCDAHDGEDKTCSDRKVSLNLLDHLNYLGFSFITNYMHCKL